eukprot:gene19626-biopygen982
MEEDSAALQAPPDRHGTQNTNETNDNMREMRCRRRRKRRIAKGTEERGKDVEPQAPPGDRKPGSPTRH